MSPGLPWSPGVPAGEPGARALRWLALGLLLTSAYLAKNYWGILVFSSWIVTTLAPAHASMLRRFGRPKVMALAFTVVSALVFAVPLTLAGVFASLRVVHWIGQGIDLVRQGGLRSLAALLSPDGRPPGPGRELHDLYRQAMGALPTVFASLGTVLQVLTDAVIQAFLFVILTYAFFLKGSSLVAAAARVSPLAPEQTRRLCRAYAETGRGVLVGVFLVVFVHGAVALGGYAIIGIPRALELAFMTAVAGLIPAVGTGLVWGPLSIVYAVEGLWGKAVAVLALGFLIGGSDNLLRPWLSRLGEVPLPTYLLFLAFFAGITAFGPSGLFLGPLVFGQAKTALELYAEAKAARTER